MTLKTRSKIYIAIVIMGALLGSIAPFIHITFPKIDKKEVILQTSYDNNKISKEIFQQQQEKLKNKRFGFTSTRSFLFALGFPFALLSCSLILLYACKYIDDKLAKTGILIASITFQFTAIYFIIWTFTAHLYNPKDFDRSTYYAMMILTSTLIITAILYFSLSRLNHKFQIATLIDFIVNIRRELFNSSDSSNERKITTEKKTFDNDMYETFEKIVK